MVVHGVHVQAYTSDFKLVAARWRVRAKYPSALLLRSELLKMSLRELSAWTWGRLDPSVSDIRTGFLPISSRVP